MNTRALKSGTILNGKYIIDSVIGEGGFGITYRATDLTLEETVAVKEYFPSAFATRDTTSGQSDEITVFSGDATVSFDKGVRKFEEEAARLAGFRKEPGIVSVLSFFYENNTGYMVMEYIDGVTLKDYLAGKGGKISQSETIEMIKPIIKALSVVHKAGIVHRDISPDNIMITGSGEAKLIDFGASRYVGTNDEKSLTVVLTEGYAPPEQYHTDGKQGPWTDIYAVCATIYKIISGNTPVGASERLIGNDRLISLAKIADVDKYFSSVVEKGMSLDKDKRYPTAEKLLAALEGRDKGSRYRKYFIIGGAIASAIILVGVILTVIKLVGLNVNNYVVAPINMKTNTENGEAKEDKNVDNNSTEKVYTEDELYALLCQESGAEIFGAYFKDFDEDGKEELFALSHLNSNTDESTHNCVWLADDNGEFFSYDIEEGIDFTASILDFGNAKHFCIEGSLISGERITYTYRYADNAISLVYSGDAELVCEDGTVYSIEDGEKCQILYAEGVYAGLTDSILTKEIINEIEGIEDVLTRGKEEINKELPDYPYLTQILSHYYSNGHIYVGFVCLSNESDYEKTMDDLFEWEYNAEISYEHNEEYGYYTAVMNGISFISAKEKEELDDKLESVPAFVSIQDSKIEYVDICYSDGASFVRITDSLENISSEFPSVSPAFYPNDENYVTILENESEAVEYIKNHLGILNDENIEIYEETTLCEDFDKDGKKEICSLICVEDKRYPITPAQNTWAYSIRLLCLIGDKGVSIYADYGYLCREVYHSVSTAQFGKSEILLYYRGNTDFIDLTGNEILINHTGETINDNEDGEPSVSTGPYSIDYGFVNNEYFASPTVDFNITACWDKAKVWYINKNIVECASVEISMEQFLMLSGSDAILNNIPEYVADKSWYPPYIGSFGHIAERYRVEKILLCSDEKIYINCVPQNNNYDSSVDEADTWIEGMIVELSVDGNSVEHIDHYKGYRECRLSSLKPYYPDINKILPDHSDIETEKASLRDAYKEFFYQNYTDEDIVYLADVTHDGREDMIVVHQDNEYYYSGHVYVYNNGIINEIFANGGGIDHAGGFYNWSIVERDDGWNLSEAYYGMWQGLGSVGIDEYYLTETGDVISVYSRYCPRDESETDEDGYVTEEAWSEYYDEIGEMTENYYEIYSSWSEYDFKTLYADPKYVFARNR